MQVAGLLQRHQMPAKLIQSNDGFSLYNLYEIRYFLDNLNLSDDSYTINKEVWAAATRLLKERFGRSDKLDLCLRLLKDFETTNSTQKYRSDLDTFIRESRLEDFAGGDNDTILVSTIHKAKGKEFDNLFLLLDGFTTETDEKKRQLYVAMTRAKNNLTIHLNTDIFESMTDADTIRTIDHTDYLPPDRLVMLLTHKDVHLGEFAYRQTPIERLTSGDALQLRESGCTNGDGEAVLFFSQNFRDKIARLKETGYCLQSATVSYILYWKAEDSEREIRIVLPQLHFVHIHP
jgi:ATP-dependent DNA helicase RecQ